MQKSVKQYWVSNVKNLLCLQTVIAKEKYVGDYICFPSRASLPYLEKQTK